MRLYLDEMIRWVIFFYYQIYYCLFAESSQHTHAKSAGVSVSPTALSALYTPRLSRLVSLCPHSTQCSLHTPAKSAGVHVSPTAPTRTAGAMRVTADPAVRGGEPGACCWCWSSPATATSRAHSETGHCLGESTSLKWIFGPLVIVINNCYSIGEQCLKFFKSLWWKLCSWHAFEVYASSA